MIKNVADCSEQRFINISIRVKNLLTYILSLTDLPSVCPVGECYGTLNPLRGCAATAEIK